MVRECLEALALKPGMIGVDATLGYGQHAAQLLEKISPGGKLIGLDIDPVELPKTATRLAALGYGLDCFEAVKSNYAGISKALAARNLASVDFVFADLGCSSMQLDDPSRGFSFKTKGPIDMRMDPERGVSAGDWLAKVSVEKLETALHEYADEPRAESIALALAGQKFPHTLALAEAVRESVRESDEDKRELTVRRVFQALRIAVNEEFSALDAFLKALPGCLKSGGRAAILTFHSGEDRRVKQFFKVGLRDGIYAEMSDGPTIATPDEQRQNPRSRSAKLRWVVKV